MTDPIDQIEPDATPDGGDGGEVLLGQAGSGSEADVDRMLARLVIDRDLATQGEVHRAVHKARGGLLRSSKPLGEQLVQLQAITPNQLERLLREIEADRAGRTIPGFTMLSTLGKGTSATVYKATQESVDRIVAVKVLPSRSLSSPALVKAFYAEARAAAQLNHPNIVQAYDVGRHGDLLYFVMEHVEGRTVHALLKERGPFDEGQALEIIIGVAQGLVHAHEQGLVHRDVKPKNILIVGGEPGAGGSELTKLADLGLARFVADEAAKRRDFGRSLGTPYFISPEQVRGDMEIGPESDIYSLGATWFYMATGRPPFDGDLASEVMAKHETEPAPDPGELRSGLDAGLVEVMLKMLEKEPVRRYHDCRSLLTELGAWRTVLNLKAGEERRQQTRLA